MLKYPVDVVRLAVWCAVLLVLCCSRSAVSKCDGVAFWNPEKNLKWAIGAPVSLIYTYRCPANKICIHQMRVGSFYKKFICQDQSTVTEVKNRYRVECNAKFGTVRFVVHNETWAERENVIVKLRVGGKTCEIFNFSVKNCPKEYKAKRLRVVNLGDTVFNSSGSVSCSDSKAQLFLERKPMAKNITICDGNAEWSRADEMQCWSAPEPKVLAKTSIGNKILSNENVTLSCEENSGFPRNLTNTWIVLNEEKLPSPITIRADLRLQNTSVYCVSGNDFTAYYNYSVRSEVEYINVISPPTDFKYEIVSVACEDDNTCSASFKVTFISNPRISKDQIGVSFGGFTSKQPNFDILREFADDGSDIVQTYRIQVTKISKEDLMKNITVHTNVIVVGESYKTSFNFNISRFIVSATDIGDAVTHETAAASITPTDVLATPLPGMAGHTRATRLSILTTRPEETTVMDTVTVGRLTGKYVTDTVKSSSPYLNQLSTETGGFTRGTRPSIVATDLTKIVAGTVTIAAGLIVLIIIAAVIALRIFLTLVFSFVVNRSEAKKGSYDFQAASAEAEEVEKS